MRDSQALVAEFELSAAYSIYWDGPGIVLRTTKKKKDKKIIQEEETKQKQQTKTMVVSGAWGGAFEHTL